MSWEDDMLDDLLPIDLLSRIHDRQDNIAQALRPIPDPPKSVYSPLATNKMVVRLTKIDNTPQWITVRCPICGPIRHTYSWPLAWGSADHHARTRH